MVLNWSASNYKKIIINTMNECAKSLKKEGFSLCMKYFRVMNVAHYKLTNLEYNHCIFVKLCLI